jgi:hypothetical protein
MLLGWTQATLGLKLRRPLALPPLAELDWRLLRVPPLPEADDESALDVDMAELRYVGGN